MTAATRKAQRAIEELQDLLDRGEFADAPEVVDAIASAKQAVEKVQRMIDEASALKEVLP